MTDLPTLSETKDAIGDAARAHTRNLLPWLPDPIRCPDCNVLMYASETFDPRQVVYVTSWHCRECDEHFYREPAYGTDILDGPRPGSMIRRQR